MTDLSAPVTADEYEVPTRMAAAVLHGPEDLRIEEVPVGRPAEDEVLLKVEVCGICGTDVHIVRGHFPVPNLPLIPGHEFSGRVVGFGDAVDRVSVGDFVTADINIGCDRCYYCRHQMRMFCPGLSQIGVHRNGAFAEYVEVPATAVYRLPDDMTPEQGAYVEPLACALHGQERAEIRAGSTVAVIGGGPMGLVHVQLSKLRGAAQIIASEPNAARRVKAAELGADVVLDPEATDPVAAVRDLTDGRGADCIIEAVGSIRTYRDALEMVRRGGTVVAYGAAPSNEVLEIKPFDLYSKELTIVGSYAGTYATWPDAIALIRSGRFDPLALISNVLPLTELVEGIEAAERDRDIIKTQVRP
jgi:2-desacetyl-2-hydroxyethyl bacteriochlorophyllide A dehydrogenase